MRHCLSLLISVALHAALLNYPVALLRSEAEELVPVVVISYEAVEADVNGTGGVEAAGDATGPAGGSSRDRKAAIENDKRGDKPPLAARPEDGMTNQLAALGAGKEDEIRAHKGQLVISIPDIDESEPEQQPLPDSPGDSEITANLFLDTRNLTDVSGDIPVASTLSDHAYSAANVRNHGPDHLYGGISSSAIDDFRSGSQGTEKQAADEGSIIGGSVGGGDGSRFGAGKGASAGARSDRGGGDGSGAGSIFIQARYAHAPGPNYPDHARREGKQGRVLLRVLVDERGRSKVTEVNQSSGSAALDSAALDAVKHWTFWPARYDNVPVESWVKIPIEFRLSNAKNH